MDKLTKMARASKAVQTGGFNYQKNLVKYCDDNIVHIFVFGTNPKDFGSENREDFAIVARNTLRLRIVPGKDTENYQEISNHSSYGLYDYCTESIYPPPLPPRRGGVQESNCLTFPRRRKNLFYHLGLDNTLPHRDKNAIIKNMGSDISQMSQHYKKDLQKYLGMEQLNIQDLTSSKNEATSLWRVTQETMERYDRKSSLDEEISSIESTQSSASSF